MDKSGLKVSRAEFEENFSKKMQDAAFRGDIQPLLRPGIEYDVDDAASYIMDEVLSRLPGKPWKGTEKQPI